MLRQPQIYKFAEKKCRYFTFTVASKIGQAQNDSLGCKGKVSELYIRESTQALGLDNFHKVYQEP